MNKYVLTLAAAVLIAAAPAYYAFQARAGDNAAASVITPNAAQQDAKDATPGAQEPASGDEAPAKAR